MFFGWRPSIFKQFLKKSVFIANNEDADHNSNLFDTLTLQNYEYAYELIKSKYPVSTKDKISNVVLIKVSGKQLYESRFENFSKKEAYTACKRLKKYNRDCFVRL